MTLDQFLTTHTPLVAVELLPDERLINVVIGEGQLYGVEVSDIPLGASVTRHSATLAGDTITTLNGLTFDTTQYTMLGSAVAAA